jgi:ubiquitin-protein ligase
MKYVARDRKTYIEQDTKDREKDRAIREDVTCLKYHLWCASNWYDSNIGRLVAEQKAMSERFPGFELRKIGNDLAWLGTVKPKGLNGKAYQIAIQYPLDYPYNPPMAFVIEPELKNSIHMYSNGSLCLMFPGDHTYTEKTTAVQAVAMATTWLWCYEYHAKHCPNGINCIKTPCSHWPGESLPFKNRL